MTTYSLSEQIKVLNGEHDRLNRLFAILVESHTIDADTAKHTLEVFGAAIDSLVALRALHDVNPNGLETRKP